MLLKFRVVFFPSKLFHSMLFRILLCGLGRGDLSDLLLESACYFLFHSWICQTLVFQFCEPVADAIFVQVFEYHDISPFDTLL